MEPTFGAVALGMLIHLGMCGSMIVDALRTGILFYLSGLAATTRSTLPRPRPRHRLRITHLKFAEARLATGLRIRQTHDASANYGVDL